MITMLGLSWENMLANLMRSLCLDTDRKETSSVSLGGLSLLVWWWLPHLQAAVPFELSVHGAVLMGKERVHPSFSLAWRSSRP